MARKPLGLSNVGKPFQCSARLKPGFHMSGKFQTIGAFTFCRPPQIYRIIATIFSVTLPMYLAGNGKCAKNWNLRDRGTGAQQFGGLLMSEIHRWRPRRYKFEFSFVGNDRRPSQKSGTRWENRNAPDSSDLSPSIPDDRGCCQSAKSGKSGNSKIPIVCDFPDIWKRGLSYGRRFLTNSYLNLWTETFQCYRSDETSLAERLCSTAVYLFLGFFRTKFCFCLFVSLCVCLFFLFVFYHYSLQ